MHLSAVCLKLNPLKLFSNFLFMRYFCFVTAKAICLIAEQCQTNAVLMSAGSRDTLMNTVRLTMLFSRHIYCFSILLDGAMCIFSLIHYIPNISNLVNFQ